MYFASRRKKYPKAIGVPPRLAKPGRDGVVTSMLSSRWTGACLYLLHEPMYAAEFWNRGLGITGFSFCHQEC